MSLITAVTSPNAQYISHIGTQTKTLTTPSQASSNTTKPPMAQDSTGEKHTRIGTKINTFA